jgi:hypothetical protein
MEVYGVFLHIPVRFADNRSSMLKFDIISEAEVLIYGS